MLCAKYGFGPSEDFVAQTSDSRSAQTIRRFCFLFCCTCIYTQTVNEASLEVWCHPGHIHSLRENLQSVHKTSHLSYIVCYTQFSTCTCTYMYMYMYMHVYMCIRAAVHSTCSSAYKHTHTHTHTHAHAHAHAHAHTHTHTTQLLVSAMFSTVSVVVSMVTAVLAPVVSVTCDIT